MAVTARAKEKENLIVEVEVVEEAAEAVVEVEAIPVHQLATLPTRQSKEKPKIDNSEDIHFNTGVVQSEVTPLSSNAHTIHELDH